MRGAADGLVGMRFRALFSLKASERKIHEHDWAADLIGSNPAVALVQPMFLGAGPRTRRARSRPGRRGLRWWASESQSEIPRACNYSRAKQELRLRHAASRQNHAYGYT